MNALNVIYPYRQNKVWVFDDASRGLSQEPFVLGASEILDVFVSGIEGAEAGFRLTFSADRWPTSSAFAEKLHDEDGGAWYEVAIPGADSMRCWLCPALLKYFDSAPQQIHFACEAMP